MRIPRVAAASLALGACGGASGDGTEGLDTSEARMAKLAERYCGLYGQCDAEGFSEAYASHDDCETRQKLRFLSFRDQNSVACADAYFDAMGCYTSLDCSEGDAFETKCRGLEEKLEMACGFDNDEEDDLWNADQNASSSLSRYRIPR